MFQYVVDGLGGVGGLAGLISIVLVIITMRHNTKREIAGDSHQLAATETKLDHIASIVERTDNKMDGFAEKLARVDESVKIAHKRIDGIERKM